MDWSTSICVASGPSLNKYDCELVARSGLPVIAVNNSWQMLPGAAVIFASDACWWDEHAAAVPHSAALWTVSRDAAARHGLHFFGSELTARTYNSGQLAIELALLQGARAVILLGYDCSIRHGIHWHGPHKALRNPDGLSVAKWHGEFSRISTAFPDALIVNCSRYTELTCFPRSNLEDVI